MSISAGDKFSVSFPMICKKHNNVKHFQAIKSFLESFATAISTFPVNELTGSMAISLPYPALVF
jgi:hypothetical protein